MKILNLQAENIKRLVAVDITPENNLVQITGKNGQGKSSVLDSIWWALEGAKNIQVKPINKDATSGRIRLELGSKEVEVVVLRTFKKTKDGGFTTKLTVTNADGTNFPGGAQTVLNGFLDALTFDPLAFTKMLPKEQFDALKKFVPGIDFEAIEKENKKDYEYRKEVNRDAKAANIAADGIAFDAVDKTEWIEVSDLTEEMKKAGEHNSDIEIRKNNRNNLRRKVQDNHTQIEKLLEETKKIEARLDNAGPLPELIDVSELIKKIDDASLSNKRLEEFDSKKSQAKKAKLLEEKSDNITTKMNLREKDKQKAIADAELPVRNITFGDGIVLLDGVPFEQGSQAEQIRASMAIAMANNPKLRVILMREGSLLDEDSEEIVRQMAIKNDFDVWQEKVDSSGKVGFVIENGSLKTETEDF